MVPLYYSAVFIHQFIFYKQVLDKEVLISRLPNSKLGNVLIIRVVSFKYIDDEGRKKIEEIIKNGEDFIKNMMYRDNNGNENFLYEQLITEENFFNKGYLNDLAE
jgi:hypothetical protein